MSKLSEKQKLFAKEFLVDLNATRAAIRAGYSKKTAHSSGPRLLANVGVAALIAKNKAQRAEKVGITSERVLEELGKIGFANILDYVRITDQGEPIVDLLEVTRDQAAAISEVVVEDFTDGRGEDARDVRKVKFKLSDKRAALVDIGKHLGMFVERKELSGPDGGPIEVAEVPASDRLRSMLDAIAPDENE